jgi:energy-coupling factor transporter ATP-binding protein EcfA2
MRLSQIDIEAIRGIPRGWPSIRVGEAGLVVYGPNGSGKSSIIDGIESALDKESSLYPEKRQGVTWEKGSEHINGGPKRTELRGKIAGIEYNITTLEDAPEELVFWRFFAESATFVLRRHMLLKFVLSQSADRYASLENFFNLENFEKLEAAINALLNGAKSIENGLDVHEARESQSLCLRLGLPSGSLVTAEAAKENLANKLRIAGLDPLISDGELMQRKQQATDELNGIVADSRFNLLSQVRGRFEELLPSSTYDQILGQLSEFQDAYIRAREESTTIVPAEFLQSAASLIEAKTLMECPVCEQTIDPSATLDSLKLRIGNDIKATNALAALNEHRSNTIRVIQDHTNAFKAAVNGCEKAFGDDFPISYRAEVKLLDELVNTLTVEKMVRNLPDFRVALKSTINTHQPLRERINKELSETGASRRTVLSDVLDAVKIIETDLVAFNSTQLHLLDARQQRAALERLSGHALQARRATVQKIVKRLAALANEFYEFIHPGEEISQTALEVREVGRGSVDLTTSFFGNTEHPLLHLSESHLDTLGLCYFLAARRLEADTDPKFKLLVLDDVVHSVDADHRGRIAQLLKSKFSDHQIVIVTHDSIFYQRLRAIFGNKYEYIYFTNWSLEGGPVRIQGSTDIDRIKSAELRNSMSQDELAGACGRFAEWLLMQLDERLEIAVQARFTRPHDLGSLWPPLASKLRKYKGFEEKKDIVDRIDASQWVRNKVGAHYNEPESPVTLNEVRELAEALNDLHSVTFCETCSNTIAKISDKRWQCDCDALKYAPEEASA